MTLTDKKYRIIEGPMFWRITLYALPIMLTGLLQMFYNMADNIVVGQFSGDVNALGAVGSTTSLNNLTLHMLLGLSAGSSVVVAQNYGAKNENTVSRAVHTAMTVALVGGMIVMATGLIISRKVLVLMGTQPELIEKAILYYRIICCGIPASAIYNFGAAILRSVGDSKTPLLILGCTGLSNVAMNLIFVIGCGMSVEGVGLATIISQYISAAAVVYILYKRKSECYSLSPKKYCFDRKLFLRILRFGIPAGFQGSMFGISNVLLTSAINTFPIAAIKAWPIASNIDGIIYNVCNSFSATAMTYSGQNYGAKKMDRVKKVFFYTILQSAVAGFSLGIILQLIAKPFASLYIDGNDPLAADILANVKEITELLLITYFLCGIMECLSSSIKGLGYSLTPMIICMVGVCGIRILWIYAIFPMESFNTIQGLLMSYPISWSLTILALSVLAIVAFKRCRRKAV